MVEGLVWARRFDESIIKSVMVLSSCAEASDDLRSVSHAAARSRDFARRLKTSIIATVTALSSPALAVGSEHCFVGVPGQASRGDLEGPLNPSVLAGFAGVTDFGGVAGPALPTCAACFVGGVRGLPHPGHPSRSGDLRGLLVSSTFPGRQGLAGFTGVPPSASPADGALLSGHRAGAGFMPSAPAFVLPCRFGLRATDGSGEFDRVCVSSVCAILDDLSRSGDGQPLLILWPLGGVERAPGLVLFARVAVEGITAPPGSRLGQRPLILVGALVFVAGS